MAGLLRSALAVRFITCLSAEVALVAALRLMRGLAAAVLVAFFQATLQLPLQATQWRLAAEAPGVRAALLVLVVAIAQLQALMPPQPPLAAGVAVVKTIPIAAHLVGLAVAVASALLQGAQGHLVKVMLAAMLIAGLVAVRVPPVLRRAQVAQVPRQASQALASLTAAAAV